jgi:RNA polymerase sigma-70 factor (ECF subfamily)
VGRARRRRDDGNVTAQDSDESLMAAYRAGDQAAFRELFRRWAPRLQRLLQRDVARAEDASDLVQQTFLQLHRARNEFRADAKLRPWLYTIALNLKRQYYRRLGRRPETSIEDTTTEAAAADRDAEARLDDARVRVALGALPEAQRDVILLHWFEGLAMGEVADIVGASVSAVKVRAHRGYARLRELLVERGVTPDAAPAYARIEGSS